MADPNLQYDPITGFNDAGVFVTNPATQAEARTLFQRLFTQIQTFINVTVIAWINATFATRTELQGVVLGQIPDNTLTSAKMANEMKKSIVDGVESFNTANSHRTNAVIHVTADDKIAWDDKATSTQGVLADNALPAASYTASNVLTKLKTVDGVGSGLDADLLDGKESISFTDKTYTDAQLALKVDKVTGKSLSTNDYDNTEKAEVAKVVLKANIVDVNTQIASVVSGSPKAVYTTLAALEAAIPAGDTNIYVVTADGNWYYWNGAWTAGGTYQSTGTADNSITQKQMSVPYIEGAIGKNKFNKNTITSGYYIDYTNGSLAVNATYGVSDYIAVAAAGQYKVSGSPEQCAYYNASKVYVSGLSGSVEVGTIPAGVSYIRLSMKLTEVNSVQLEPGTVITVYEEYNIKVNADKLNFLPVIGIPSKNLFNKDTVTTGHYVEWNTGNIAANSTYSASDYINVLPNTEYIKVDNSQFAFYDSNKTYISGVAGGNSFTTPVNCVNVRLTIYNTNVDKEQLELGTVSTSYENFGVNYLSDEHIRKVKTTNPIIVAKIDGDYTTITDAILNANDSVDNQVIIRIMPGIYIESLNLIGRYITLRGVNRDTCIIKTFTNDYHNPPIDLSTNSNIENLTIIADDDGVTTPEGGVDGLSAYAIHFDIAGRGYDVNNVLYQGISRIKNCLLISKNKQAVGIGTSNQQKLIIEDSELVGYDHEAIYAHSYLPAGSTNQKLIIRNCDIHNNSSTSPTMLLQDANVWGGSGNDTIDTEFTFIRNNFWNEVSGRTNVLNTLTPLEAGSLDGHIKLGKGSFDNSIAQLNSQ